MTLTPDAARLLGYLPDYYGDEQDHDPLLARILGAQGAEMSRRRQTLERVRQTYVPARATDELGALSRWETELGIPAGQQGASVEQRQGQLVARLIARRAVGKGRWAQAVTRVLGTDRWEAHENTPTAYQLEFVMPFEQGGPTAARAEALVGRVTPANLDIVFRYTTGFRVGVSRVGDAL